MSKPIVHILLATCQGHAFLQQQLDSIESQTYKNWDLWVSDDGSTDDTRDVVIQFAKKHAQKVTLLLGPCKGSTHNFFHLINSVSSIEPQCLFSYCDQDDVWLPEKLARAVKHFESTQSAAQRPYLYCSRTQVVDEKLQFMELSNVPIRPLAFGNALLQNLAGGNTMVFNRALIKILRLINPHHSVLHDWTTYQVVTGCNGIVYFDVVPSLLYRQHQKNLVGVNIGMVSSLQRLNFMLRGGYKRWAFQTELAMTDIAQWLTPSSRGVFELFCTTRRPGNSWSRFFVVMRGDFWCQSKRGHIAYMCALFFGLI